VRSELPAPLTLTGSPRARIAVLTTRFSSRERRRERSLSRRCRFGAVRFYRLAGRRSPITAFSLLRSNSSCRDRNHSESNDSYSEPKPFGFGENTGDNADESFVLVSQQETLRVSCDGTVSPHPGPSLRSVGGRDGEAVSSSLETRDLRLAAETPRSRRFVQALHASRTTPSRRKAWRGFEGSGPFGNSAAR
jgi:hypothetical protein